MMWVYFEDTGLFHLTNFDVDDPIFYEAGIRMTLDYEEDLAFFGAIFEHYNCINNGVPLRNIVPFLKKHPEIVQLNAFRRQGWAAIGGKQSSS